MFSLKWPGLRGLRPGPPPAAGGGAESGLSFGEVVDALYTALLGRAPTPRERSEGEVRLAADRSAGSLAETLVNRTAFKQRVSDARARWGLSEDRLINDVAQNGEIEVLLKLVVNKACPTRTVVDAGARGRDGSNAYDLMRHFGWRGLLIEANPSLAEAIRADFAGLDCVVESCAVSDYDGEAVFTLGINDDVSSLDGAAAEMWGPAHGRVTVPVRRLGPLLERHAVPLTFDLLSLDIEGEDVKVLNDLVETTAYRPAWIILEGPSGGWEARLDVIGCSTRVRAEYHVVANTPSNLLFEHRERA